jgi:hypothetical protein
MVDVNKIFEDSEKFLDDMVDSHEERLIKAIKKLEKRIVNMTKDLPTSRGSLKYEAEALRRFHKELIKEFNNIYGTTVDSITKDYNEVDKQLKQELNDLDIATGFTSADRSMMEALKEQSNVTLADIGNTSQNKLISGVYDTVVGGSAFSELVDLIKNELTGLENMTGRSMTSYASGFAHDSLMDYYSTVNFRKGEQAGLKEYLYAGNIIKSSRAFCIARAGKVFDHKTVKSWEKRSWKGKKEGNIFIVRGGYNCRHHFRPIKKEWIDSGEVKVGNYFDENPEAYTANIQKEVNKELKSL